jgi:hypothetical protein
MTREDVVSEHNSDTKAFLTGTEHVKIRCLRPSITEPYK